MDTCLPPNKFLHPYAREVLHPCADVTARGTPEHAARQHGHDGGTGVICRDQGLATYPVGALLQHVHAEGRARQVRGRWRAGAGGGAGGRAA